MTVVWLLTVLPPTTRAEVPLGAGLAATATGAAGEAAVVLAEACTRWRGATYRVQIGEVEILAVPGQTSSGDVEPVTAADLIAAAPHLLAADRL